MYRSIQTVKADAARRSYPELGEDIVWAVISSGIDGTHPHFDAHETVGGPVAGLHRDFIGNGAGADAALIDPLGLGTHVAGIVAGGLDRQYARDLLVVYEASFDEVGVRSVTRVDVDPEDMSGIAPRCRLVSLRVMDDQGQCRPSTFLQALEYIRRDINGDGRLQRIHGVVAPLGFEWDPDRFACGASLICLEVDRLVASGVTVVVPAGNTGSGQYDSISMHEMKNTGFLVTIKDPGNAEGAITVGSTHREEPHRFGVSHFSSKGPTADGRSKPDLVAPGELVVSCTAGRILEGVEKPIDGGAIYAPQSGTSVASAHVAGVIAAFLSVHREFIGRPTDVKRIILDSATSLNRREEFQGRGLVDLMRAVLSV